MCRRLIGARCWVTHHDGGRQGRARDAWARAAWWLRWRACCCSSSAPGKAAALAAVVSVRLAVRARPVAREPCLGGRAQPDRWRLGARAAAVLQAALRRFPLTALLGCRCCWRLRICCRGCARRTMHRARRSSPASTGISTRPSFMCGRSFTLRLAGPRAAAAPRPCAAPHREQGVCGGRLRPVRAHHDLRRGRLDDVADAALAFDGIRPADRHRPGAGGDRRRDCLRRLRWSGGSMAPRRQRFHDLGNLTLALVMLWAYLALMQFLIIWIEDLPDEIRLVPAAHPDQLEYADRRSWSLRISCCRSCSCCRAAPSATPAHARGGGRSAPVGLPRRQLLAGRADFPAPGIRTAVERPRRAAGHRRSLAG